MARVNIPVTRVAVGGTAPPAQVEADAAEDHTIDPGADAIILECENVGTVEAQTVTVRTPGTSGGMDVEELAVEVPKEAVRLIRLEANSTFRQKDGKVYVDVSSADLRFRAYRV